MEGILRIRRAFVIAALLLLVGTGRHGPDIERGPSGTPHLLFALAGHPS